MEADALLSKANQLYADEKFAEAKTAYAQSLAGGPRASALYNLGNAHFRLGDPGQATLAYERALALEPGFAEAAANLKFTREKAGARIAESAFWESPLLHLRTPLAFRMGEASLALSILAALWGSTHRERRGWLWAAAGVQFLIISLGAAMWLAVKRHAEFAIVTASAADARTEPADRAGLAEALPAGSRVRVIAAHGAWTHCLLPGGGRAWLPSQTVETICQ
jgi:tetratricopeptide (TPR) repeat protein